MTRVFISYSRTDADADANALYQSLVAEFGPKEIYKDVETMPVGVNWQDNLISAVENSAVVLALMGPQWTPTDPITLELSTAIEKDIPVIPLLVRGADLGKLTSGLKSPLDRISAVNGASLRHPTWSSDLAPVLEAIRNIALSPEPPPVDQEGLDPGRNSDDRAATRSRAARWAEQAPGLPDLPQPGGVGCYWPAIAIGVVALLAAGYLAIGDDPSEESSASAPSTDDVSAIGEFCAEGT